jgi:hypothetical protein
MYWTNPRLRLRMWPVLFAVVVGCSDSPPVDDRYAALDPKNLVPMSGLVTIGGKPVPMVVITFLPPTGAGLATGETDSSGKFTLKSAGGPGAVPGEYKVAISYLVSPKGVPQGVGARATMSPGPDLLTATEHLPPEYSDLGRTKISFTVGAERGRFDYDVPVTLPAKEEKPEAKKAADDSTTKDKKPADESASQDKKAADANTAKGKTE